jgi:hypothetical protein
MFVDHLIVDFDFLMAMVFCLKMTAEAVVVSWKYQLVLQLSVLACLIFPSIPFQVSKKFQVIIGLVGEYSYLFFLVNL